MLRWSPLFGEPFAIVSVRHCHRPSISALPRPARFGFSRFYINVFICLFK